MSLKGKMPFLKDHEGVWEGYYRYYDQDGLKIDEHRSRLLCRVVNDTDYHQTNLYRWKDGKSEDRDFPAQIKDNRLFFSGPIDGWAAKVDLDDYQRTLLLYWERKNEPDMYLYEMIQVSNDGNNRARTWHWFKNGILAKRTLIDEVKLTKDWSDFDGKNPNYEDILKVV